MQPLDSSGEYQQSTSTRDSVMPAGTMNNNPVNEIAQSSSRDGFMNERNSTQDFMNGESSTQRPVHSETIVLTDVDMQDKKSNVSHSRSPSPDRHGKQHSPYVGHADSVQNSRSSSHDKIEQK